METAIFFSPKGRCPPFWRALLSKHFLVARPKNPIFHQKSYKMPLFSHILLYNMQHSLKKDSKLASGSVPPPIPFSCLRASIVNVKSSHATYLSPINFHYIPYIASDLLILDICKTINENFYMMCNQNVHYEAGMKEELEHVKASNDILSQEVPGMIPFNTV